MYLQTHERVLLVDILNNHLEGMDDAKERMIEDPVSFPNIDSFTETLAQHDQDVQTILAIKEKILNDDPDPAG